MNDSDYIDPSVLAWLKWLFCRPPFCLCNGKWTLFSLALRKQNCRIELFNGAYRLKSPLIHQGNQIIGSGIDNTVLRATAAQRADAFLLTLGH
jgi:hypothetical protein